MHKIYFITTSHFFQMKEENAISKNELITIKEWAQKKIVLISLNKREKYWEKNKKSAVTPTPKLSSSFQLPYSPLFTFYIIPTKDASFYINFSRYSSTFFAVLFEFEENNSYFARERSNLRYVIALFFPTRRICLQCFGYMMLLRTFYIIIIIF